MTPLRRLMDRNYDVMVRYHPVARRIRERDPERRWRVLDVGCGDGGLAPFLAGWPLTGVDRVPPVGRLAPLRFCQASATALPFCDGSWDVVTCIDVMEHLTPESRARAVSEIVRVARRMVIVGGPSGPAARRADESMHRAYSRDGQKPPAWLEEHLQQPPLDAAQLLADVRSALGVASGLDRCTLFFNESLALQRVHRHLARTTRIGYRAFSLLCSLAVPLLARPIAAAGAYRCLVVATRSRDDT